MLKNYFKIAWRNTMKNKIFSFINIFGLSIGLTCCMLITLYIYNELRYDRFHKNIKRLYQLGTTFVKDGKEDKNYGTPAPMAEAMKREYPEIEEATRMLQLFNEDKTLLQLKEGNGTPKSFYESKGYLADGSFFKLFSYDFVEGNPATALDKPNTLVISEEIAKKCFGDKPALNKIIHISSGTNGETDCKITGVFRPTTKPSQFDARFFISMKGGNIEQFMNQQTDMIVNNMFYTFFLLKPGADWEKLERKFPAFVDKYLGTGLKEMGFQKKLYLIPVKDIHLRAPMSTDITPVGSITYLYILGSIAVFTLLIACINFMNLSTAQSSKRSAEVGVRKVLGAGKQSLLWQFLGESVLMSTIAFVFALALTKVLLPAFSQMSGRNLSFDFSQYWPVIIGFFVLSVITGLLSGSYPALYLSSFQPSRVLKGKFKNSLSAVFLRKGLVIFQFIISITLIIASVVIGNQMRYMRSTDLGFAKDQQIIIPLRDETAKNICPALKNAIRQNKAVLQAGATQYYPGRINLSDMAIYREGKTMNDAKRIRVNSVDESFLQTLGLKLVAGRMFSPEFPADTGGSIVVNEEAIKETGFASPEQAVNRKVFFDFRDKKYTFTIVGIVKDFHFEDLHVAITPYCFTLLNQPYYNYLVVHSRAADINSVLNTIEASWSKLNPGEPFEYTFLDEDFQKNYEADNRLSAMVGYFTVIAILISCLGLFGLAAFSAEQRTKEIGVRKVLGASVLNIAGLLSKDFLKLVIVAILIASPIAWFVMNKWLLDFAYRTSISWKVFAITTGTALLIALLTVSFNAIKAAIANPVKSLRTE